MRQVLPLLLVGLWAPVCFGQPPADFAHDVMPILRKHCVECHGGREAKGSFSMNTRELLIDSGQVVVGKPDESQLLTLIASADAKLQMPPKDRERLSPDEQATLRRWIESDLLWDDGISFAAVAYEPPLRPRAADRPKAGWPRRCLS